MWNFDLSYDVVSLVVEQLKVVDQEVWCHAQKTDEKVSEEVEVDVYATRLDLVKRAQ